MKTPEELEDDELLEDFTDAIVEIMDICEDAGIYGTFDGPVPGVGMVKELASRYKTLLTGNSTSSL